MLAVVDTNVIVSGLLGSPACRSIFKAMKENVFRLAISSVLTDELIEVIKRPKFSGLMNSLEKEDILSFIRFQTLVVTPSRPLLVCRDPQDNMVLECAVEAEVDGIVTSDLDLLSLRSFERIPILTPGQFLKKIREASG